MTYTDPRAEARALSELLLPVVVRGLARTGAVLNAWRRAIADRRVIADLTPEQLKDIGLEVPRPAPDEVRTAIIITNLNSMR